LAVVGVGTPGLVTARSLAGGLVAVGVFFSVAGIRAGLKSLALVPQTTYAGFGPGVRILSQPQTLLGVVLIAAGLLLLLVVRARAVRPAQREQEEPGAVRPDA